MRETGSIQAVHEDEFIETFDAYSLLVWTGLGSGILCNLMDRDRMKECIWIAQRGDKALHIQSRNTHGETEMSVVRM